MSEYDDMTDDEVRETLADLRDWVNRLEHERNEARRLCQWAFPRLCEICHDCYEIETRSAAAERMMDHPEIFNQTKED